MERLIKYALRIGYYGQTQKEITCVKDILQSFGAEEVSMILEVAQTAEIPLETLVQYANEVVLEIKAKKEAAAA